MWTAGHHQWSEPAFNPLKDALAKKKDGKKGGITLGIGSDKNQMQALGDAVKARLEMDKDFETQDENVPPPPAVALEGPPLPGLCGGFVGIFERQPKREMEGGARAYRSVRNPVLWLARDGAGRVARPGGGKLGEMASLLKLADKACLHPSSTTDEPWQYIDPETRDWEKAWRHKCREATGRGGGRYACIAAGGARVPLSRGPCAAGRDGVRFCGPLHARKGDEGARGGGPRGAWFTLLAPASEPVALHCESE